MQHSLSTGEIYTGATVEEWSERRVLQHALTILDSTGQPYVVLANFHLGGRQIDCVIATDNLILLLEVKTSRLPVRGSLDGDWHRLEASGQWRNYGNGYRQALAAKNALRDAMRTQKQVGSFYPDAAVVFADPLPQRSQLTRGDFKVEVLELAALNITGAAGRATPWTIEDWRDFAERLSLTRTTPVELMKGAEFGAASSVLRDYRERLAVECSRDGSLWLSESDDQRAQLLAALEQSPGLAILGPSGCGKTLVARWLGSTCAGAGECVLFLSAKDFAGSWSQLLRRELALITTASVTQLLHAVHVTGAPVRIILDGANELGASRSAALVGLRALARRLDAPLIVTDQSISEDQLGGLSVIAVAPPTLLLKENIARSRIDAISSAVRDLLKAVTSGFEAAMIAEIGADVRQGASRQLLVDQYIRLRLGDAGRSGSVGLRRFAEWLVDTTSFSMAETAFDELLIGAGVLPAAIDPAFSSNLLVRRGGRISFSHEILLNACAAYAFAQHAPGTGAKFAYLLALPSLQSIATDILSVVEDEAVVASILRATRDAALLTEAAEGLSGQIAAKVANGLLDEIEVAIATEVNGLRLSIASGEAPSLTWEDGARRDWNEEERARLFALSRRIAAGERIERYFEFCAAMDAVLLSERRRLAETAATVGMKALKSNAFQLAYFGYGEDTGFGLIT